MKSDVDKHNLGYIKNIFPLKNKAGAIIFWCNEPIVNRTIQMHE